MKYLKGIIIILIVISISILLLIATIKHNEKQNLENNNTVNRTENSITSNNINKENIIIENQIGTNTVENNNIIDDTSILQYQQEVQEYIEENPGMVIDGVIPQKTTAVYILYTLQNCVRQYINYTLASDDGAIYGLLSNDYINEYNIKQNNVFDYVQMYTYSETDEFIEVYEVVGNTYSTYYIKYQLGENIIFLIVNMDISTDSFSVIPINETEYNEKIVEPAQGTEKEKTILRNKYNNINYVTR